MITALRDRARPDNLPNQVRKGSKSFARQLYLGTVLSMMGGIGYIVAAPWFILDTTGIVTRDIQVVATDHSGVVTQIKVSAGDTVEAGQTVAILQSKDMLERIADLSARIGQIATRKSQVDTRLDAINQLRPLAAERHARARAFVDRINELATRGLTTITRTAETLRDVYEAERDLSQLGSEALALEDERRQLETSRRDLEILVANTRLAYNDGRVVARVSGTVAAHVISAGAVVQRGAALIEIFHGEPQVRGFLPSGRLYSITAGDLVVVSDGVSHRHGVIERVEQVSERLPHEFQPQLRAIERQQIMRIVLGSADNPFPSPSKVKILGASTPSGLIASAAARLQPVDPALPTQMIARSGRRAPIDKTAVGSIPATPHREPKAAFVADWRVIVDPADIRLWRPFDGTIESRSTPPQVGRP